MNKIFNRLSFKIGAIIILVEMIVLTALGIVYINRFSNQVDRRIEAQAQLPGVLMNAGLLSFDSVSDPATMRELVGDELITGMVVGVNGNVFYALDPDLLGMDVADIPAVDADLFDINELQDVVIRDPERVIAVSPIYAADQRTPRFFVYTVVSNREAAAEKAALTRLFVFGSLATLLLTSLVIIISFHQVISKRISGLVEILKRVEIGDMTTRVQGPKSQDEIGFLQRSTNNMIDARQQTEIQIIHLNRVLQAIRNVNQLITQERDLARLLESACDRLTETASYAAAWILLLDDDGAPAKFIRKDMEGNTLSLTELLEGGELMACAQAVLAQAGAQIMADGADVCQDCFLFGKRGSPYNAMAIRLEYDGKIYGVLNVTVLTEYAINAEEISLFEELATDISFALYSLEIEEERVGAEERAQRLLEQQIAVNQLALALGETRDLDEIYHTIYQHIQAMVDAWGFIVSSYDNETQLIRAEYLMYKGTVLDVAEFPPILLTEPGQGGQSQVIHTGKPRYDPDHRKSRENGRPVYTVEEDGTIREGPPPEEDADSPRSALYVPMNVAGKTIGVMQLQSPRLDAYSPKDIDLLAAMANVAAVAVQNVRLYGEVERELAERTRAEEALAEQTQALRESEEKYRLLAETARDYIVVHDLQGRITYINQTGLTFSGYSEEEILLAHITEFVSPEYMAALGERRDKRIMGNGERYLYESELVNKAGERLLVEVSSSLIEEDGKITSFLLVARDITERKRAEEELRKHREHLEELVRERTAELRKMVNLMAGREVRMAELKDVIRQLRAQVQEAGLTPVADDPLLSVSDLWR